MNFGDIAVGSRRVNTMGKHGSGGAPYALACGWRLRDRVVRTAAVSGLGPPESAHLASAGTRTNWWYARRAPAALWLRCLGRGGWKVLSECVISRGQVRSYRDTFRRGPWGPYSDVRLSAEPWGFDPHEIQTPVGFWHGVADSVVPIEVARTLAASIPRSQTFFVEGLGHDLSQSVGEAVIRWLTAQSTAA